MASPLVWKVYRGRELHAATAYAEDAARMLDSDDTVIKVDGRVVWNQARDASPASLDSVDYVADLMHQRRAQNANVRYARAHGLGIGSVLASQS